MFGIFLLVSQQKGVIVFWSCCLFQNVSVGEQKWFNIDFGFLFRSWVPLGKTQWRITSPAQSPALPGPRPAPQPWIPTMSKLLVFFIY